MKNFEQYVGIFISALYSLIIRYLAEYGYININSSANLIITPMVVGFIPFFYKSDVLLKSIIKTIFFPLFSTLLFLVIAVITRIEELLCFFIIGIPYILISILISLVIRTFQRRRKSTSIHSNYMPPLLLLPLLFSSIEKEFQVESRHYITSNTLTIDKNNVSIWKNLYAVPNISGFTQTSFVNILGIPKPIKSTYNQEKNIRIGYFDNGMMLHEKVVTEEMYRKLSFAIDFKKSIINQSPTLLNAINEKSIVFEEISYELTPINATKTKVKLYCKYTINSNLQSYGSEIANLILSDFETNLLYSLKQKLENK